MSKKQSHRIRAGALVAAFGVATLTGCASARMSDHVSDRLFRQGNYEEAAARLKTGLEEQGEDGRDQLLYLLDLGLAYHMAGKYAESNQAFLKADQIAEIKDYTSLSAEASTLLTSDNIKDYKGEDFEKVLINTYLAINYSLMGQYEDALVEARRVNRKLHLMITEGERKYKQNAFARYLSAILYEAEGNHNDAYVDYKQTWELDPNFPGLGEDLWRMAWKLDMDDEMERWEQKFKLSVEEKKKAQRLASKKTDQGEIVVIYQNGISPVKRPHYNWHSIPKFYPRYNPSSYARVSVDGVPSGETAVLHDIESTAIENLDEKYAGIIARKVAGVVAKEAVGYQVERATNSPLIGLVTKLVFYASDQADVRSWNLLPKDLQILRIPVSAGVHAVKLDAVGGGELPEKTVHVDAGKKVFVNFRYAPY